MPKLIVVNRAGEESTIEVEDGLTVLAKDQQVPG